MKDDIFYDVDIEEQQQKYDDILDRILVLESDVSDMQMRLEKLEKITTATVRLLIFSLFVVVMLFAAIVFIR